MTDFSNTFNQENGSAKKQRRASGEGSLRQRADGLWEARTPGYAPKSFYGKTPEEALRKVSMFRGHPIPEDLTNIEGKGDVYFVQSVIGGPIKIGIASDPQERLRVLQACSPFALRFLHVIRSGGPKLERGLHKRFALHRLHGEWFDACGELLKYISDAKKSAKEAKKRRAGAKNR